MSDTPDILTPNPVEIRPALSSTGDAPVFLSPPPPAEGVVPAPSGAESIEPPSEASSDGGGGDDQGSGVRGQEEEKPTEEAAPEAEPEAKPKISERFSDYAARTRAAEARADKLANMLEQALARFEAGTAKEEVAEKVAEVIPPPAPEPRPTREQFIDPSDYDAALVTWAMGEADRKAEARFKEATAAERKATQEAAEKAANDRQQSDQMAADRARWEDRRTKAMAKHEDYTTVAESDTVVSPAVIHGIFTSEDGPEIAYYLGHHPEEAARLTAIANPSVVMMELGKLAAKITAPPAPRVTRVPAPIEPLGSNAAAGPKDIDDMSMDEYAEQRNSKL